MEIKNPYQLDAFEMQYAVMAAERRNVGKQPNGVVDRKHCDRLNDFGANLIGMIGELAVARALGLKPDNSISLKGDGGAIDLVYGKATIQVKTTVTTGQLIFDSVDHFKADVAVGCKILYPNKVKIYGWVSRGYFLEQCYSKDYGYGPRAVMNLEDLFQIGTEIESLKSYLDGHQ